MNYRACLALFGLLVPTLAGAQPQDTSWMCVPGIKTPVRVHSGNVECAASNGRDCRWGACPSNSTAPTTCQPPAGPLVPLVCGADHQAKHGTDGDSKPDHWCRTACNAMRCGQ